MGPSSSTPVWFHGRKYRHIGGKSHWQDGQIRQGEQLRLMEKVEST